MVGLSKGIEGGCRRVVEKKNFSVCVMYCVSLGCKLRTAIGYLISLSDDLFDTMCFFVLARRVRDISSIQVEIALSCRSSALVI
jgi:hypothetical protein